MCLTGTGLYAASDHTGSTVCGAAPIPNEPMGAVQCQKSQKLFVTG